jgi:REP element-mobilizing transposase RayT
VLLFLRATGEIRMPRRARISIAGIPWHVIQRGNNRSACFYADEDYRKAKGSGFDIAY